MSSQLGILRRERWIHPSKDVVPFRGYRIVVSCVLPYHLGLQSVDDWILWALLARILCRAAFANEALDRGFDITRSRLYQIRGRYLHV